MHHELDYKLLGRFGIKRGWDPKDRAKVIKHNKILWQQYKQERGFDENTPVDQIPGFIKSLDRLHNFYGDSLTDIGTYFGLGHERIRQYFEKYELERRDDEHGSSLRTWSWQKKRFVTISGQDYQNRVREERRKRIEERCEEKRQSHVRKLQDLAKRSNGRVSVKRFTKALRCGVRAITHYWGQYGENSLSDQQALDVLYREARVKRKRNKVYLEREARTIGARLTRKRLEQELTLTEASVCLQVYFTTISAHERNKYRPSEDILKKYAKFYKVSKNWLLTGKH